MTHQVDIISKRFYNIHMKSILICLILSLISLTANALGSAWSLTEIGEEKQIVGYIYHIGSLGTRFGDTATKHPTSLRLICSTKVKDVDPLVGIFWQGNNGYIDVNVSVKIDGKTITTGLWNQTGQLTHRDASDSAELIQALKTGKTVKFEWISSDSTRRVTAFSLTGLNFAEFNTKCKTHI
jgi:hypothetical protein